MKRARLLSILAVAALVGCKSDPPASTTGPDEHDVTVDETSIPHDLGPGLKPEKSRDVRRMKLDTLQASMTAVAGKDVYGNPIFWHFNGVDGFSDAAFGKALGRPDFLTATTESNVSNALYLKFVGDAARDICTQMAKNDLLRSDATTRTLFPKAPVDGSASDAQITENLQYLILRFLGLRVDAADPMIPALRKVFDAGTSSVALPGGAELTPAAEGFRGVCVTLFESPLFHND